MPHITINPRWRVQLEGEPADIVLLEKLLGQSAKSADDFVIARLNDVKVLRPLSLVQPGNEVDPPTDVRLSDVPVLTTTKWDKIGTREELAAEAATQLNVLAGCLTMLTGSAPITIGTVYEVRPDGAYNLSRVTALNLRIRVNEKDHPTPTDFKAIVELADSVEAVSNLLFLQAQEMDWFVLYKMIEAIENHLGGESAMRSCSFLNGQELKRAKQMANFARHLNSTKHRPPATPLGIEEAKVLLGQSVKQLIDELRRPRSN